MKSLEVLKIELEPRAGAHIGECIREAAIHCLKEQADVVFVHNGTLYSIYFNSLLACYTNKDVLP